MKFVTFGFCMDLVLELQNFRRRAFDKKFGLLIVFLENFILDFGLLCLVFEFGLVEILFGFVGVFFFWSSSAIRMTLLCWFELG